MKIKRRAVNGRFLEIKVPKLVEVKVMLLCAVCMVKPTVPSISEKPWLSFLQCSCRFFRWSCPACSGLHWGEKITSKTLKFKSKSKR